MNTVARHLFVYWPEVACGASGGQPRDCSRSRGPKAALGRSMTCFRTPSSLTPQAPRKAFCTRGPLLHNARKRSIMRPGPFPGPRQESRSQGALAHKIAGAILDDAQRRPRRGEAQDGPSKSPGAICANKKRSRPISRVLSRAIIPLGPTSPWVSSGLPGSARGSGAACSVARACCFPIWPYSRWGLPCQPCYQGRGALLPHRFTLAVPRGFTRESLGGLLSVALSVGSRPPGVTWHPDPPEPGLSSPPNDVEAAIARPTPARDLTRTRGTSGVNALSAGPVESGMTERSLQGSVSGR